MPATKSACSFLKRFPAGSTLVTRPGNCWQSTMSDAWSAATGTVHRSFCGAYASTNPRTITTFPGAPTPSRTRPPALYGRANALAPKPAPPRQTGGIRYFQESEFLEDVFTMNDFGWPLKPPNHPLYLNTEFVGHTYPTKTIDQVERLTQHTVRHARVHDQLASNPQYAGGIGWCSFDYNTHGDFGSGDRICYHGVTDIFREPKPAAGFYKLQADSL